MILDIITLILIVVFAIIGAKKGAAKVFFNLLSYVAAFLFSIFLSHFLAELVYNTFLKQTITDNITNVMNDSGLATATEKASDFLSALPAFFANAFSYFGVSEDSFSAMFTDSAVSGIEGAVMTPVVGVTSLILFIILFVVLLFVFKKIFGAIAKIFRLPLINIADTVVGLVLGILEGILAVYLLALLLKLIIPLTGGNILFLNETYIADSVLFSFFYFGGLSSVLQGFLYSISNK